MYRTFFKPSKQLAQPHAMVGVNIIAAETDAEARRLATTQQMSSTNMIRNSRGLSKAPIDDIETYWTPLEKSKSCASSRVRNRLAETVRSGIDALVERTQADELMIVSDVFEHAARRRSYELIATAMAAREPQPAI